MIARLHNASFPMLSAFRNFLDSGSETPRTKAPASMLLSRSCARPTYKKTLLNAPDTVLAELADWNDWITTEGVRDLVDHYIDRKVEPVIDVIAQGVKGRIKNMPPLTSAIQPSRTLEKYKKLITTQLADIFDRITT